MEKQNRACGDLSPEEMKLIEQLRERPLIRERVRRILEIGDSTEGRLKSADEVEELLIEEMRRLGNETMTTWARHAQERVGRELKSEDPTVLKRKKKR